MIAKILKIIQNTKYLGGYFEGISNTLKHIKKWV